jgi:Ca2+:H+ antiporter
VGRKLLWASLVLAPVTFAADLLHAGHVALFVLAAVALIPLAWLIGEATEHAAGHTGPGVGGFLNASFGNAPELIIALFAVSDDLPNVVRGSLAGSVVSNLLLVLGVTMLLGPDRAPLNRNSLLAQIGLVVLAVLAFLVPAVPGFHGDPERHSLAVAGIPVSVALLAVYAGVTYANLRRSRRRHAASGEVATGWSLPRALVALGLTTAATAVISEILVHSLDAFAKSAGLSEFFVSAVIVAIVGNAAEHGGAVVIARHGNVELASEIAISSSAQVGLLVTPVVALLSFAVTPALALTFRPVELGAMGAAAVAVAIGVAGGRSRRREGALLVALYVAVAVGFLLAGDR